MAETREGIDVAELWAEHLTAEPVTVDWSEGFAESWECYPWDPDEGDEGPMMNYAYPIGDDLRPFEGDVTEAGARVADGLPLCLVEWIDQERPSPWGDRYALALTGGGMDLSWEICEGYIRLGFLPPAHFADLPMMAGRERDPSTPLVVAAMRQTLEAVSHRAERDVARLDQLEEWMAERAEGGEDR